jgi:hypothetical protein
MTEPPEADAAPRPPAVIAVVRDLILGSRVSAVAAGLGVAVRTVRDPGKLAAVAGDRLIVDLNEPGAIEAAVAWRAAAPGRRVAGFVSHVDAATVRRAREAGVDQVMARSRFVEVLPRLLADAGAWRNAAEGSGG